MKFCLILLSFLLTQRLLSQDIIPHEKQKGIIEKLCFELQRNYFDASKAKSMADTLQSIMIEFREPKTINRFCADINAAMRIKSNDNHLNLYLDAEKFGSYSDSPEAIFNFEYNQAKSINFGFSEVDILQGNIGYIKIIKFSEFIGEHVAEKLASAMNLVEHTDALILDLRFNNGGDGRVAELLSTYFYPEKNEVYYDSTTRSNRFRVLPYVAGKRYLDRPVYILTGLLTFSAAEYFVKFMQQNKKAFIVGEKTKGGGNAGDSFPLLDGFLCFIPTTYIGEDTHVSITPDYPVSEAQALNFAKKLCYNYLLEQKNNSLELEIIDWNLGLMEYLIDEDKKELPLPKELTGNYTMETKIFKNNESLYISGKGRNYKLVQLGENEFIVEGSEDKYGQGNRRIIVYPGYIIEMIFLNGKFFSRRLDKI